MRKFILRIIIITWWCLVAAACDVIEGVARRNIVLPCTAVDYDFGEVLWTKTIGFETTSFESRICKSNISFEFPGDTEMIKFNKYTLNKTNGDLTILNLNRKFDEGVYYCGFRCKGNNAKYSKHQLVVNESPRELALYVNTNGKSIIFVCKTIGGSKPDAIINITRQINGKDHLKFDDLTITTTPLENDFTITEVVAVIREARHENSFEVITCVASNKKTNWSLTQQKIILPPSVFGGSKVKYPWLHEEIDSINYNLQRSSHRLIPGMFRIEKTPDKRLYKENDTVKLSVFPVSDESTVNLLPYPAPTYTWFVKKFEVAHQVKGTEKYYDLKVTGNSTVYCLVKNPLGQIMFVVDIKVAEKKKNKKSLETLMKFHPSKFYSAALFIVIVIMASIALPYL